MDRAFDIVVQGLFVGAEWGLVAVAFGLVVRITGIFHLALGGMFGLASYLCFWLVEDAELHYSLAIAGAAIAAGVLGLVIDRLVYQPITGLRGQQRVHEVAPFVASLGVLIVLNNVAHLWYGASPKGGSTPALGVADLAGVRAQNWDFVKVAISLVAVLVVVAWLTRTRAGRGAVALGQSAEGAGVVGVDERTVRLVLFGFTGVLAGLGGAMAVLSHPVVPGQGLGVVLYAALITLIFPAANMLTWWLTAVAVGILHTAASVEAGSGWAEVVVQVVLMSSLVVARILLPQFRRRRHIQEERSAARATLLAESRNDAGAPV